MSENNFEQRLEGMRQLVEANSRGLAELREAQAMLVQIVSQQQDSFQEFRRTTKATLDRMELNQEQTNRELAAQRQEMLSLQQQVLTLQQNQTGIQTEIRRILDIILEPEQE